MCAVRNSHYIDSMSLYVIKLCLYNARLVTKNIFALVLLFFSQNYKPLVNMYIIAHTVSITNYVIIQAICNAIILLLVLF